MDGIAPSSAWSLAGDNLSRFAYLDEAGISADEPVVVVAGVIVDADRHLKQLEAFMREFRFRL
jgi:hypothetical protein